MRYRAASTLLVLPLVLAACAGADAREPSRPPSASAATQAAALAPGLADSHFHIANYAMQGIPIKTLIDDYMGDVVQRSVVYGLPLQQKWDPYEDYADGRMPPNYYMGPDAPMYFYSAIDDMVATDYATLSAEDRLRVDPMIVGFNPMDGYGAQHVRRMLLMHPGTFVGVGEFSVHKELVEDKIADDAPVRTDGTLPADARTSSPSTLESPALDELLELATEAGLVVALHSDVYPATVTPAGEIRSLAPDEPYTQEMIALCQRTPDATVIWAHTGLGRFVKPAPDHLDQVRAVLDGCPAWSIDLSWDLVQRTIVEPAEGMPSTADWVALIQDYPDRVLWGSDSVIHTKNKIDDAGEVVLGAAMPVADYRAVTTILDPVMAALPVDVAAKVRGLNHARIFDRARADVRAWEAEHAAESIWDLPDPVLRE